MFTQRRFPWFLVALVGVTIVSSAPGLARAGVILVVSTNPQPGVLACLGVNGQCVLCAANGKPGQGLQRRRRGRSRAERLRHIVRLHLA